MNTRITFQAPYVDEHTGEKMNFVYEYKVPKNTFERIQEILTKQLKAHVSGRTFSFPSREDLYQGLENVASLMVTCK